MFLNCFTFDYANVFSTILSGILHEVVSNILGILRCIIVALLSYGPRREKTCLQGFRESETQTSLPSYID